MRKIFVDMDGVLADFDTGYEQKFGVRPRKDANNIDSNVDWDLVRTTPNFYMHLPPMPDMEELWHGVILLATQYQCTWPVVLTGIPYSIVQAASNKRKWAAKNLGDHIQMICCLSKEKYKFASPGDILIDDWTKYEQRWIDAGGVFIHHLNAALSLETLRKILEENHERQNDV